MFPIHQPGIEVRRIEMLNGSKEFCQEFLTDVRVPDADRIGEVNDGWTVGTRWMFHERMRDNSPFVTTPVGAARDGGAESGDARESPAPPAGSTTRACATSSARRRCCRPSGRS